MTPEFSQLVNPIIRHGIDTLDRVRVGGANLKETKADLKSMLDRAEHQAAAPDSRVSELEWKFAQRVLIYWLDEVLTVANSHWQSITLEWEYYASQDRAWRFYYDWETEAKKSTSNIAELWYLCLVLGFEGDIGNAFGEHLNSPIPVGTSPEEFRKQWAGELAKLKSSLYELKSQVIACGEKEGILKRVATHKIGDDYFAVFAGEDGGKSFHGR